VDKKQLLRPKLAKIMVDFVTPILDLVRKFPNATPSQKNDGTPVTELDLKLSSLLESMAESYYPEVTAYSEENYADWKFPLLAIDPLDGTKEYLLRRPEWVISLGLLESEQFEGEGWIFNPSTGEIFDSTKQLPIFVEKSEYYGEVSHSEWGKGLYRSFKNSKFKLSPMGSIAYKLARLANGESDFVVSLAPKNIWDIAGGTLLCFKSGMKFYSQGKEVTKVQKLYQPPLIWSSSEVSPELLKLFERTDRYL
jgi:myo-inositol-1(or 4)-monophosphatase